MKRFRAPSTADRQLQRIVKKIYDDINEIARPVTDEKPKNKAAKKGDFRFVHDKSKNQYVMEVLFPGNRWVRFSGSTELESIPRSFGIGPSGLLGSGSGENEVFLDLNYYIKTTSTVIDFVDSIPINNPITVSKGQRIRIIDYNTLYSEFFTIALDQKDTKLLSVNPRSNVRKLLTGSYVDLEPYDSKNPVGNIVQVGRITSDTQAEVTSLDVELFTSLVVGSDIEIPNLRYNPSDLPEGEEVPAYFKASIAQEVDYTGDVPQHYAKGFHTLPISTLTYVNAAVDTPIYMSGIELFSYIYTDLETIILNVTRSKDNDAIGVFSEPRSGVTTHIDVKEVKGEIELVNQQELWIFNDKGEGEKVTIDGNQVLSIGANSINIVDTILVHEYETDLAWLREPDWELTGRITLEAGRIDALAIRTADSEQYISQLLLDVTDNGTAISSLTSRVSTVAGFDGDIIYSDIPPVNRNNNDPLIHGDYWVETDNNDKVYVWDDTAGLWDENLYTGNLQTSMAGLTNRVTANEAQSVLKAEVSENNQITSLASISLNASIDGVSSIALSADLVSINGVTFDSAGAMYSNNFITSGGEIDTGINAGVVKIAGTQGWALDRSGILYAEKPVFRDANYTWTGGGITEGGIDLNASGGKLSLSSEYAEALTWSFPEAYPDTKVGLIYSYALSVTGFTNSDSILHLAAGVDTSLGYVDGVGEIHLSAGQIHFVNDAEVYYKGQTLDARFGNSFSGSWTDLTNRLFTSIDSNTLEINNGVLRIANVKVQQWDDDSWRAIHSDPVANSDLISISSGWAHTHETGTGIGKHIPSGGSSGQYLNYMGQWVNLPETVVHNTPTNGATSAAISSNWAFDNVKTAVPSGAVFTDSKWDGGSTGLDEISARTNLGLTGNSNTTHYHDGRYYTKSDSDGRYLQSFTETDPTVPQWVKNINSGDISNWDTAYNLRSQWNGGSTNLNVATALSSLGLSDTDGVEFERLGVGTAPPVSNGNWVASINAGAGTNGGLYIGGGTTKESIKAEGTIVADDFQLL